MNPTFGAYTVALPWYEREHFEQLLELAVDRIDFSPDYDVWRAKALAVAEQHLARGQAIQLVTIRPREFLSWLRERHFQNTAANRLLYVEFLAIAQLKTVLLPPQQEVDHASHKSDERTEDRA